MIRIVAVSFALLAALAAPAFGADPTPVAEILGRTVSLAELDDGRPDGTDNAGARARARAERLRALVWSAVFEDYAERRKITASEAEIESNVRAHARLGERLRGERETQRAALAEELRSSSLSEARRRQARESIEVLDRLQAFDAQRERDLRDPAHRALQREAERKVAAHWVRGWKINQALYREFGGRIAFQQAGWEPIDAYRRLLDRYVERKAFVVHDPALRHAPYAYFDHHFVYADPARGDYYFEKPWWERSPEELKAAGF